MKKKRILLVEIVVLAICLVMVLFLNINKNKETATITLPYDLNDGKLTIQSIFQSSIDNPDYNDTYGDDIASLEIVNNSDQLLEEADIVVKTNDKSLLFHVESLPPKETMWVFESKNQTIDLDEVYFDISIESQYIEQSLLTDVLDISVEDYQTEVVLTNKTTDNLENISIDFHTDFGDILLGGKKYCYQIKQLKENESTTVDVLESFMGTPKAVQIKILGKEE